MGTCACTFSIRALEWGLVAKPEPSSAENRSTACDNTLTVGFRAVLTTIKLLISKSFSQEEKDLQFIIFILPIFAIEACDWDQPELNFVWED